MNTILPSRLLRFSASAVAIVLFLIGAVSCSQRNEQPSLIKEQLPGGSAKSDGPAITKNPFPHEKGDAVAGRDVYRFETFGNEGPGVVADKTVGDIAKSSVGAITQHRHWNRPKQRP